MAKNQGGQLAVVSLVVKLVAMAAGLIGTLIGLMAIVGAFTESGWARALVALVVSIGLPLFIADRLLPADTSKPAAGIVTDVPALSWFGFSFLFAGVLHAATKPMLLKEGDRLTESGWVSLGGLAYFLASANAEASPSGGGEPSGSASAAASAGASAGPASSGTAAAADAGAP